MWYNKYRYALITVSKTKMTVACHDVSRKISENIRWRIISYEGNENNKYLIERGNNVVYYTQGDT